MPAKLECCCEHAQDKSPAEFDWEITPKQKLNERCKKKTVKVFIYDLKENLSLQALYRYSTMLSPAMSPQGGGKAREQTYTVYATTY